MVINGDELDRVIIGERCQGDSDGEGKTFGVEVEKFLGERFPEESHAGVDVRNPLSDECVGEPAHDPLCRPADEGNLHALFCPGPHDHVCFLLSENFQEGWELL